MAFVSLSGFDGALQADVATLVGSQGGTGLVAGQGLPGHRIVRAERPDRRVLGALPRLVPR